MKKNHYSLFAIRKNGFSPLELLFFVAVIGIVFSGAVVSFTSFRRSQSLTVDTNKIVTVLKIARSKTLASKDFSQYGVHFDAGQAVLFKGVSYSANDSNNATTTLSSTVEIFIPVSLNGGGSEVVFKRLTGITDNYGYVILRDKNNASETGRINIGNAGVIEIQ